jgi:hypothetical protein
LDANSRKANAVLRQQEYHATTTETATRARKLTDEGLFRSKSGKLIDANPTAIAIAESSESNDLDGAGEADGTFLGANHTFALEDVIGSHNC